jgi:polyisoprenoid-binding protein YceI
MKRAKKISTTLFLLLFTCVMVNAQEKTTNNAYISFYSELDAIKAENFNVTSRLNMDTGTIIFSVPIKSFEFESAMMQEHFNQEDVMDSNKFPISKFKGSIENFEAIPKKKNGIYPITITGDLTIKGVAKQTTQNGNLIVKNEIIQLELTFDLDRYIWGMKAKEGSVSKILQLQLKSFYK